jgi:hypothetical protein
MLQDLLTVNQEAHLRRRDSGTLTFENPTIDILTLLYDPRAYIDMMTSDPGR